MSVPISISIQAQAAQFYRKPHDLEIISYDLGDWRYGGDGYRLGKVRDRVVQSGKGLPEVYHQSPDQVTPLNCHWQWLWRDLNPDLTDGAWSSLLGNHEAWTNNTGFPGRHNCITGEDYDQNFPAFHKPIINGGTILKGRVDGNYLIPDTLIESNPVPDAYYVMSRPWLWYWGTSVLPTGQVNYITKLGKDDNYHPVRIPLITETPLRIPLNWLHKLPLGMPLPDPRWMAS